MIVITCCIHCDCTLPVSKVVIYRYAGIKWFRNKAWTSAALVVISSPENIAYLVCDRWCGSEWVIFEIPFPST